MTTRTWIRLALAAVLLLASCARLPDIGITKIITPPPPAPAQLHSQLLTRKPEIEQFRLRGPFEVTVHEDRVLPLSSKEQIEADVYLAAPSQKGPLVILLHGLDNSKEDHAYQAYHLASWGLNSVSLQLPNQGPWVRNGQTLARVVRLIRQKPELIDARVDPDSIVLAGHSYGGTAVAVALAEGAPAVGAVLLDPAGVGKGVIKYLGRVAKPVVVLAADRNVILTRNRYFFYSYIPKGVVEVFIRGAHHDDAAFPLGFNLPGLGVEATQEMRVTYVSALTAAAFGLAATGRMDYAWVSIETAMRGGRMYGARRK